MKNLWILNTRYLWYRVIVVLGIVVAIVPACVAPEPPKQTPSNQWNASSFAHFVDEEYGVVCWVNGSSISCVPLSQTRKGE